MSVSIIWWLVGKGWEDFNLFSESVKILQEAEVQPKDIYKFGHPLGIPFRHKKVQPVAENFWELETFWASLGLGCKNFI